jgi:UDP-N-acetyl-D-mannosaminuronic acid dehydrogenase
MPQTADPQVVVVGLGYIGLPTAALIARTGFAVTGVDVNAHVVETINSGGVHIEEVDLDGLVQGVVARGALKAALIPPPADIFVIAVPTPVAAGRAPDVTYVHDAARAIAPVLAPGNLVILESTSPVGTTESLARLLAELRPDLHFPGTGAERHDVHIAYCPERVLPGRILVELVENDRCIGGISPACTEAAIAFYKRFVRGDCIATNARAAEMVKLVENSFRDVNIAFANELSMLADRAGIDVWEVIGLANRHPRVNILQPGPGVGGHCIAVDPWFLVHADPEKARLIRTAREVNLDKTRHVVARAEALIAANPAARIACLGLAFKPNIDDFRESPAVEVALQLAQRYGERVDVVEPFASALPPALAECGARLTSLDAALSACDIVLMLVDHDAFKAVDPQCLEDKQIYDTRGIWHRL